jgi:predicted cation transporter
MALTLGVGITALVYRDSAGDLVITGWDLADQATRENIEASFICCGLRSTSEEPTCPVHTPDVAPCFDKLVGALHEPLLIVGITGVVLGAVQQCVLIGICIIGTKRHHERE